MKRCPDKDTPESDLELIREFGRFLAGEMTPEERKAYLMNGGAPATDDRKTTE